MPRTMRTAMAVLVSGAVLLPFMILGLVIRLVPLIAGRIAKLLEPRFVPWTELTMYDPVLGWRPRPNLNTRYLPARDDVFKVVTDAEGWPGIASVEESDIIALGDSFAFGYGVDPEHSYFASRGRVTVKAVGAPGYSMVHGVRVLEELGQRLTGKVVVWFVYLENDLQDNLAPNLHHYRAPFLRLNRETGKWEIAADHISQEPWLTSNANKDRFGFLAQMCVPGPIADRAFSACSHLLDCANALCRAVDAKLVVLTLPHRILLHDEGRARLAAMTDIPERFDPAFPHQRFRELCGCLDIPFIAGDNEFEFSDYKRLEGIHWNRKGHRKMASLLERIYQNASTVKANADDQCATLAVRTITS